MQLSVTQSHVQLSQFDHVDLLRVCPPVVDYNHYFCYTVLIRTILFIIISFISPEYIVSQLVFGFLYLTELIKYAGRKCSIRFSIFKMLLASYC